MSILASGGGHGTQSIEVRARLLDGPYGSGDHPGDHTVGGRARFAEQVGSANSGAGHHLPAATLEGVLKIVLVGGGNQRLPTSHQARRDKCPLPPFLLCAQDKLQPKLYMIVLAALPPNPFF